MAAPTIYRSSDTSAPVLNGTAGSLVSVLDACLVNGYGSKAAAGWTKAFSAANQASYRQGGGNQFYLDVDDRGASGVLTGATAQEAAVRGYEAMSAVSTGTNPFPTAAQIAVATANWRKSSVADSVARAWMVVADDRTFHLYIRDGDVALAGKFYTFGDVYSIKSADGFRTGIMVRSVQNSTAATGTLYNSFSAGFANVTTGFYIARVAATTGTSVNGGILVLGSSSDASTPLFTSLDENIYLDRIVATQVSTPFLRGWFRGLWHMHNAQGMNDGDTFTGTGELAGRSFLVVQGINGTNTNFLAIETTTWDTST